MKIKPEDYATLAAMLATKDTDFYRSRYASAGLSTTRYQWDLVRATGAMPFLCDTLYKYLNDTHVQTALNRIVKPLTEAPYIPPEETMTKTTS